MTLHTARPTDPALAQTSNYLTDALDISLIGDDTYCLLGSNFTLGYVQQRGNTFVGLLGEDLSQAMVVGESLSFDATVAMVVDAYRR